MRIFGTAHDCSSGTIGHASTIEESERARHFGGLLDRFDGDLFAELRTRVTGTVVMVLHGDVAKCCAHGVFVDTKLIAIGRNNHREHRRSSKRASGSVIRDRVGVEALEAGVLHLFRANNHAEVIRSRGQCIGSLTKRFRTGCAVVLDSGDRLVLQLQGASKSDTAHCALRSAEPVGVDIVFVNTGRGIGLVRGVDHHVVEAGSPVLNEVGAAHPDDGYLVANSMTSHGSASPSRSSCGCHRR